MLQHFLYYTHKKKKQSFNSHIIKYQDIFLLLNCLYCDKNFLAKHVLVNQTRNLVTYDPILWWRWKFYQNSTRPNGPNDLVAEKIFRYQIIISLQKFYWHDFTVSTRFENKNWLYKVLVADLQQFVTVWLEKLFSTT